MNTGNNLGNFKTLVIGAGRGGTSLMAALLDAHPNVECAMELGGIPILLGREFQAQSADVFGERVSAFISACVMESKRHDGVLWCNKITTEQLRGLEDHNSVPGNAPMDILDEFFNVRLKGIKVIFILRDGRTCVRSKVARTGQPVVEACKKWKYSVSVMRFLSSRHNNSIIVKFEDLISDPVSVLGSICNFIGIKFAPEMTKGTLNEKLRPEYKQNGFITSKLTLDGVPEECESELKEELVELGYL